MESFTLYPKTVRNAIINMVFTSKSNDIPNIAKTPKLLVYREEEQ